MSNTAASVTTLAMQSHKNQVHRLLLIDRALQQNTFRAPGGVTRDSLEASVKALLVGDPGNHPTKPTSSSVSFDELWKGKNAFWRDLNFILTHYPDIIQK